VRRIILVEDEEAHAHLIEHAFATNEPETVFCLAGTLAKAQALIDEETPSLLILDFLLPDGRGIDLLTARETPVNFPVIILTSHGTEKIAVDAMKAGALDYVVKSADAFAKMPQIADRVIREWGHIQNHRIAENRLATSEERFRSLVEHSSDMIIEATLDGMIHYASPRTKEILGFSESEELSGRCLLDFLHSDDKVSFEKLLGTLVNGAMLRSLEHRLLHSDGTWLWIETKGSSISSMSEDTRVVVTCRDVTERKLMEEERRLSEMRLENSFQRTVEVLADAMSAVDPYTQGHEQTVARMAVAIGQRLGLDKDALRGLRMAGLLHDIGKIAIPQSVLVKTGKLREEEMALVRTHVDRAREILAGVDFPWPEISGIFEHHERLDGSGYPRGMKGSEISLSGRVIAVADTLSAMICHRPYRVARPIEVCCQVLREGAGSWYDPEVVDIALELVQSGEVELS
jgi:PAS domain S-box-containing protein